MKRNLLLLSLLLYLFSSNLHAQVYFETSFKTDAEFNQFTLYDMDGLKPFYSDWGTTAPYKAWIRDKYNDSFVAVSTSYYSPAGKANDWLVSPAITIPAGVNNAKLSWVGMAYDQNYKDGYKVYISTTGKQVADFTDGPIFTVAGEDVHLTYHSVSLSQYAGKTIYVAWVNDSYDMYVLGITDIVVGVSSISLTPNISQYITENEASIQGIIKNKLNVLTAFTANYTVNGQTYSQDFSSLNIAEGANYSFTMNQKISLAIGQSASYEFWISTPTYQTEKQTGTIGRVSEQFPRKIVGEEATGTWCQWCPRGAVYMEYMKNTYPNTFLGIAVHNGDPMTVTEYDRAVSAKVGGYPSGLINRIFITDPSNFESYYKGQITQVTPAKITLSAQFTDASKTRIVADIRSDFAVNYNNTAKFSLSIVVTENNVKGTTAGYNQANAYAGGSNGAMGGYENLPSTVPASQMVYQDVARSLFGTFNGFSESIPQTVSIGTPTNYTYTFDLPSSILNINNVEITAFIIDNNTGEILNGDRIAASNIYVTGIKEIELSGLTVNAYKNSPETVAVDVETENEKAVSIAIYGLDGKLVKEIAPVPVTGFKQFTISSHNLNGLYLIKVKAGQQIVTKKIVL